MSVEHVAAAMEELQRSETTAKRRKELDKFLLDFQRSRRAWEMCLETLHDLQKPVALRILLAQTIKQKACRDCIIGSTSHFSAPQKGRDASAETLSTVEFHSLVNPVVELCAKETTTPVRLQLCLTLSALLLRSESEPAQAVSQVLEKLNGSAALLTFVSVMPEEWASDRVKVSPERRAAGMAALRDSTASVLLPLLHQEYGSQATDEGRENLLRCFTTWITTGSVRADLLLATPFVEAAACALSHQPLTHAACELLIGAVGVGEVQQLAPLMPPMMAALRAATGQATAGDLDAVGSCEALIGPIMALAEALTDSICGGRCPNSEPIFEAICECGVHPVIGVSTHALGFWSTLRASEIKAAAATGALRLPFLDTPYIVALRFIVNRSAYPDVERWVSMDADEKEELYTYRRGMRDVLRSVVTTRDGTLKLFLEWASGAMAEAAAVPGWAPNTTAQRWQPLEAVMHALTPMAKFVPAEEATHMPTLMAVVCSLPTGHAGTALSAVSCISQSAHWLSQRPELLKAGFEFIVNSLHLPTNAVGGFLMCTPGSDDNYAAVSLLRLCRTGTAQLAQLGVGARLVEVHGALEATPGMNVLTVDNVLKAVCEVLSVMPGPEAAGLLEALCLPVTRQVCALGAGGVALEAAILQLHRVEAIVGHVRPPQTQQGPPPAHPAVVIMRCIWEAVPPLTVCEHAQVQAAACAVLRAAVCNAGMALGAMLISIIDDSATAIERAPSGPHRVALMHLLKACCKVAGPDQEVIQHMQEATARAAACVLSLVVLQGPDEDPELTQGVFELGSTAFQTMPGAVGPHLLQLIRCAISPGLCTQHRDAGMAVLRFLKGVTGWCGEAPDGRRAAALAGVEEMGVGLVAALFRAVDGEMLSWALIPAVEIMRTLLDTLGLQVFERLVTAAVVLEDVPRLGVKPSTKETFVKEILSQKAQQDKKKFKTLIKAFCGGKKKGDLSSQQKGAAFVSKN